MNDTMAEKTIEDHKYLLELVENKCAIAFFACINRNQSLYNALKKYCNAQIETGWNDILKAEDSDERLFCLESTFRKLITEYDIMSIVMYPTLRARRDFVHDCWTIAKISENEELKLAVSADKYFYLTREDLLILLKTQDDATIAHLLASKTNLLVRDDESYRLIMIKGEQVDYTQTT